MKFPIGAFLYVFNRVINLILWNEKILVKKEIS